MTGRLVTPRVRAGVWQVSDSRTTVRFRATGLGRSVTGSVAVCWGWVEVDGSGAPVRAGAELDLASVCTGIARRDADLRTARFLHVDRHPSASWTATGFRRVDGGWLADGVLSVRGTLAPLALRGGPVGPTPDEEHLHVRADGELDRRTVGISVPALLVGRTVRIEVDARLAL
ncbi:YceI family protein [Modestobacter sp. SSW1-42]|uniref:YceI family protein n=1 Tax=Modestobacter sp. SSW1-42 TaxID=596372 RepID=UPI00398798D7